MGQEGFKTSVVDNVTSALRTMAAEPIDLVLIELKHTDASALQILSPIRQCDRELPIVMVSANPPVEVVVEAMRAGASGYLDRRNSAEDLIARLERILASTRLRTEAPLANGGDSNGQLLKLTDQGINLEGLERDLVVQALQLTRGNQTRAGKLLGLNRDQIRYRIKKFSLRTQESIHPAAGQLSAR